MTFSTRPEKTERHFWKAPEDAILSHGEDLVDPTNSIVGLKSEFEGAHASSVLREAVDSGKGKQLGGVAASWRCMRTARFPNAVAWRVTAPVLCVQQPPTTNWRRHPRCRLRWMWWVSC